MIVYLFIRNHLHLRHLITTESRKAPVLLHLLIQENFSYTVYIYYYMKRKEINNNYSFYHWYLVLLLLLGGLWFPLYLFNHSYQLQQLLTYHEK